MNNNNTKIAVIGIGGVGGTIASMLAAHGTDVTVVVKKEERAKAIRKNGLILHSGLKGELRGKPVAVLEDASMLEDPEVVFICVKGYSLNGVCASLIHKVTPRTVIIPIMNGVDPGDRIRVMLPGCTILDALVYIVAYANEDHSITQEGKNFRVVLGKNHQNHKESIAIKAVENILREAEIPVQVSEDISCEIWRKYILNCAYNVMTAAHDKTVGQLREDPAMVSDYKKLAWEAYQVGKQMGVALKEEHVEEIINVFLNEYTYGTTSSLHRDFRAHHEAEVETFSGYIVKQAMRFGIDVPVTRKYYQILKAKLS